MYIADRSVLSLYASGRTRGIVAHLGADAGYVGAIEGGRGLAQAIYCFNVPGEDLDKFLMRMLEERGYSCTKESEGEVVRGIKEKVCYVAEDVGEEMKRGPPERLCELPDGQLIAIGKERFLCPEALFEPSLIGYESNGLHECIHSTILRSDDYLRDDLSSNIVLSGGCSMLPGIAARVQKEVYLLGLPAKMIVPKERKNAVWLGGSILSSLPIFQQIWTTKECYDESGPWIVSRKF
uniref:Actin n=1 Tax=Arcella intermedia TaxID=1963864 RepID=A0A6B2LFG8_9EUKA